MDKTLAHLVPLPTRSRGVEALEALAGMIEAAGVQVGDRLPPEIQLAQTLGIGRSTLREALNRWEALGIIRRRRGDGTYLAAPVRITDGALPVMVQLQGQAILRILEVRRALETEVVRLAAQRATPAERRRIGQLCDRLLALVAAGAPNRPADHAFHEAIAEAAGNPIFGDLLRQLGQMLDRSAESPFERADFGLPSFPLHRDLAEAVVRGDADGAAAALHAIIDSVAAEIRATIA